MYGIDRAETVRLIRMSYQRVGIGCRNGLESETARTRVKSQDSGSEIHWQ